jgi:hypothetical protein
MPTPGTAATGNTYISRVSFGLSLSGLVTVCVLFCLCHCRFHGFSGMLRVGSNPNHGIRCLLKWLSDVQPGGSLLSEPLLTASQQETHSSHLGDGALPWWTSTFGMPARTYV